MLRDILDMMVIDKRDTVDEMDFPVKAVKFDTMMTLLGKARRLPEIYWNFSKGFELQIFDRSTSPLSVSLNESPSILM